MMRSYDSILAQHEDLRGHTITHAGWDSLAEYLQERPGHTYKAIDEFFTSEAEGYIDASHDEFVEPIEDTTALFMALSNPHSSALDCGNAELDPEADSVSTHTDVHDGDVYLGNFRVVGTPSYVLYPHATKNFRTFTDKWGESVQVKVDETKPERLTILSRQLVILTTRIIPAKINGLGNVLSTIPHGVEVDTDEKRTLLVTHATSPEVAAKFKAKHEKELIPA